MERVILFDFFGVVTADKMFASEALFPLLKDHVSYNLFKKKYLAYAFGIIGESEFWEGIPDAAKASGIKAIRNMKLNHDVVEFASSIQNQGSTCMVASEAPKDWIVEVLTQNDLSDLFDGTYISSDIGTTKPFEGYFEYIEDNIDVAPEAIVFIDDSPENVAAACKRGYSAFLFPDEFDEFRKALNG